MDDIRLEGKPLPLPPAMNGTQWGQATTARNVERKCLSRTNCKLVDCKHPLVCVDNWNEAVCAYVSVRLIHSLKNNHLLSLRKE